MESNTRNVVDNDKGKDWLTKEDLLARYRKERTSFFNEYKESIPEHVRLSILHQAGHAVTAYCDGCPLIIVGEGTLIKKDINDINEPAQRSVRFLHHPIKSESLNIRKNDKFLVTWKQARIILAGPAIELMEAGYCSEDGARDIIKAQSLMQANGLQSDSKEIRSRMFSINMVLKMWWFKIASVCQDLSESYLESPVDFKAYIPGLLSEENPEIEKWIMRTKPRCSWPSWVKSLATK